MLGKLRYVAPMLGACLMGAPAIAQPTEAATVAPAEALSAAETVWHMRAALNVAALACRGADGEDTVRLYNAMLHDAAEPLAQAAAGTEQIYRKRFATRWQDAEDGAMTRLYNGFAAQNGHDAFCATAHSVLRGLSAVEPSDFANFAAAALAQLEAPFAAPAAAPAAAAAPPIVAAVEIQSAPSQQVASLGSGGATARPMTIAFAD